ncbi:MAG: hypothetical protein J6Y74_02835 [Clostridia bacterium]|nr:hypothetical protein [Clostridia bacterium]
MKAEVAAFEERFTLQGRRYVRDGRLFLNASGASLFGRFRGRKLSFLLWSDYAEKGRNAYVRLTVDGKTKRYRLPRGEKTLVVSLSQGTHAFEIVKLTESTNNAFALASVETDGVFLPKEEKAGLKLEFIGDSVTTGFGVLAKETYGEYKTKEQDFTKAFPYLTAKALGAAYCVTAAGGWPIYKSKYAPYAIPDFYENVDLLRNETKWDFSSYTPDIVVVTLGTNDFSYLADLSAEKEKEERAEVRKHFLAFIKRLLALYPEAKIVLFYGFFEYAGLGELTKAAVRELASPRVTCLETPSAASQDDVRAGHPGKKTHSLAAKRLLEHIKNL